MPFSVLKVRHCDHRSGKTKIGLYRPSGKCDPRLGDSNLNDQQLALQTLNPSVARQGINSTYQACQGLSVHWAKVPSTGPGHSATLTSGFCPKA